MTSLRKSSPEYCVSPSISATQALQWPPAAPQLAVAFSRVPPQAFRADAGPNAEYSSAPATSSSGICGVWIKDSAASDLRAYKRQLDLMRLDRLQKMAAERLIEGIEIARDGDELSVFYLTVVPFFRVNILARAKDCWWLLI